ncbi:MAG: F0F1 ATP synthase subunit A [Patescibacteria group bacterium]|nr:F0F1 ATP synthase subunit A [Patescibacteria group bacterium]
MLVALPPLAAETMFTLGSLPITNSYINTTIATLLFVLAAFFVSRGIKKYYTKSVAPKGFLNFVESIVEVILDYCDQVTRDRKKSLQFMPIAGALFLFILVSNWMGLIPGTGSIGIWHLVHGEHELVPLFRPGNTDLNMTVAMAVLAVSSSHLLGIMAIGFFKYANKFIKLGDLWQAVKSLSPVKMLIAFIEFFVGLIEIFSEIAKMVSLSLRLYGNIFAGEVLLTVLASLIAFFVPLPFMALEILVGLIQAVVFSMLTLVYLNMATMEAHGGHDAEHEAAAGH